MLDLDRATEAAVAAFPNKDPERLRETISRLVEEVRAEEIEPGDFHFRATYGIWVQRIHFADEETPDAVHVFLDAACDYDIGELI